MNVRSIFTNRHFVFWNAWQVKEEAMLPGQHGIVPSPHTMFFGRQLYENTVAHAEEHTLQQLEQAQAAASSLEENAAQQLQQAELAAEKQQPLQPVVPEPARNLEELMAREAALKQELKRDVTVIKDKAAFLEAQEVKLETRLTERRARMQEFEECKQKVLSQRAALTARLELREDPHDRDTMLKLDAYNLKLQVGYEKMQKDQTEDASKMQKLQEKKDKMMKQEEAYMFRHHEHKQMCSEVATLQQQQKEGTAPAAGTGLPSSGSQTRQQQIADAEAMKHLEKLQEDHRTAMVKETAEKREAKEAAEVAEERAQLMQSQQEKQRQFEEALRLSQQKFLAEQQQELQALEEKERRLKKAVQVAMEEKQLAEKREAQLAQQRLQERQAEEQRLQREAEEERLQREAEEQRLQQAAEELRLQQAAEELRLQQQQAEELRLQQAAEELRLQQAAEAQRLQQQQAEAQRLQQEQVEAYRLQQQAEAQRLQQQQAEAQRLQQQQAEAYRLQQEAEEAKRQQTLTLRERLAEEEEKGRRLVEELAQRQAFLRAEIQKEDRKEMEVEEEMQKEHDTRQGVHRLLEDLAHREKAWNMEVDEEVEHEEPASPVSKKARTGHTPRVVPPPTTKYQPAPLQPGRVQSGYWPSATATPAVPGPYQSLQPCPSPAAAPQQTQQYQQPQQPLQVKAKPPFPPSSCLGIFSGLFDLKTKGTFKKTKEHNVCTNICSNILHKSF